MTQPARYRTAAELLEVIRLMVVCDRLTVHDLAEDLGVDKRTVYRIVEVLRRLNAPIRSVREGGRVVYWMRRGELLDWLLTESILVGVQEDLVPTVRTVEE